MIEVTEYISSIGHDRSEQVDPTELEIPKIIHNYIIVGVCNRGCAPEP